MEEVYPREEPRGGAVIARDTAGGRTVYIPWNIGGIFWEVLAADHGRLIANAVRWALKDPSRVEVTGKVGARRRAPRERRRPRGDPAQPDQPDDAEGPDPRDLSRSARSRSRSRSTARRSPRARLLVAGREVPVRTEGGRAIVEVPGIDTLEVVHLTWR